MRHMSKYLNILWECAWGGCKKMLTNKELIRSIKK